MCGRAASMTASRSARVARSSAAREHARYLRAADPLNLPRLACARHRIQHDSARASLPMHARGMLYTRALSSRTWSWHERPGPLHREPLKAQRRADAAKVDAQIPAMARNQTRIGASVLPTALGKTRLPLGPEFPAGLGDASKGLRTLRRRVERVCHRKGAGMFRTHRSPMVGRGEEGR